MARTVPGRRVVVASEILAETVEAVEAQKPETKVRPNLRKLNYKERLERRLEMADMALLKYEQRLEAGDHLEPEEERLFLAHQDSIRKLENTLAMLEAKAVASEKKTDAEYAVDLIDAGWSLEDACRMFKHNPRIMSEVEGVLSERE